MIGERLWAQEIQAQHELERHWSTVKQWSSELLIDYGINRITAEELTVPPGMDELFSLLELKRHADSEEFDVIIVDCAPTGETLRLLSFPEVARWWLERFFPRERDLMSAARPLAKVLLDIPLPNDAVLAEIRRLMENLVEMNELLRDSERVSVRLVMSPDRMVIGEAMSMFTYLNLYGYLTDAVIVNRIFPAGTEEGYFATWHEHQREQLERVCAAFAPVPIKKAPFLDREIVGLEMLGQLGNALFGDGEAGAVLHDRIEHGLEHSGDHARLTVPLPLAEKGEVSLKQIGRELVISVGERKRIMMLPPVLEEFRPTRAKFSDGALQIDFDAPDPKDRQDQRPATPAGVGGATQ